MALQRAADDAPARALSIAERWARDPDPLVRRAAVAALSEPRLLRADTFAARALALIDGVTADLAASAPGTRRSPQRDGWRRARAILAATEYSPAPAMSAMTTSRANTNTTAPRTAAMPMRIEFVVRSVVILGTVRPPAAGEVCSEAPARPVSTAGMP